MGDQPRMASKLGYHREMRPILLSALFLLGSGVTTSAQLDPDTPNVLVVLLDDWGVDRFDAYQPSTARTPVLDHVASVSLRFLRAYADPVCSPTRSAALTSGQMAPRGPAANRFALARLVERGVRNLTPAVRKMSLES